MQFEEIAPDCVAYTSGHIDPESASRYFAAFRDSIVWRQEHITFGGGSKVALPRLVAWHGDPGARYFYSGIQNEPMPWTPELQALKAGCDALFPSHPFNSVLLNYYRSGADSIGYHVDNERDLVDNSTIATISLGGQRTFHLKDRTDTGDVRKVTLQHGSLLLMYGECQKRWLHGIPKEPELNEPRISLTFRTVRIR